MLNVEYNIYIHILFKKKKKKKKKFLKNLKKK